MGTKQQEGLCMICGKIISNPICPKCIQKEVEESIRESFGSIKEIDSEGVLCVICGRMFNVCSSCFIKDIFEIIKEKSPEKIDEIRMYLGKYVEELPTIIL